MTLHVPKEDPSRKVRWRAVKLYLDDLQLLEDAIAPACPDLKIGADEATADRVEDLRGLERVNELKLSSQELGVTLSVAPEGAVLTCSGQNRVGWGVAAEMERLVSMHRRRFLILRVLSLVLLPPLILLAFLFVSLSRMLEVEDGGTFTGSTLSPWVLLGPALSVLSLIVVAQYVRREPRLCIVIPRTRKEAPSFWRRNSDELAVNALVSTVFLILGIVIGRVST